MTGYGPPVVSVGCQVCHGTVMIGTTVYDTLHISDYNGDSHEYLYEWRCSCGNVEILQVPEED